MGRIWGVTNSKPLRNECPIVNKDKNCRKIRLNSMQTLLEI